MSIVRYPLGVEVEKRSRFLFLYITKIGKSIRICKSDGSDKSDKSDGSDGSDGSESSPRHPQITGGSVLASGNNCVNL